MIMECAFVLDFVQARDHRVGSVFRPSLMTVMGSVAEVVAEMNRGAENTCPCDVIYQIRMQKRDHREEYFSRR
jgi:hypothetical protein